MNDRGFPTPAKILLILLIVVAASMLSTAAVRLADSEPRPLDGAIRYSPTLEYHDWYEKTAQCAQLPNLDYYKIEWYVIPDVVTFPTDIGDKVALWEQLPNGYSRITVADFYVGNEMVVRHEMLHDLLNRFGHPTGHPALYFEERCGLTWSTWKGHTQ